MKYQSCLKSSKAHPEEAGEIKEFFYNYVSV